MVVGSPVKDCWKRIGVWSDAGERCPELATVVHCRICPVYTSAGRHLLDREIPENFRREWTAVYARTRAEKKVTVQSAFVFRTGGEWLALPAKLIQEVVEFGVIHTIPHRSSNILRGVVNIRGKLEICFSIGAVLGIERFEKSDEKEEKYISPSRLVVAERAGERIVFPVSEVYGSFRYAEGMLQQLPVTVAGSRVAFTRGVLCVEKLDVGFLNDQALFEALMRSLL